MAVAMSARLVSNAAPKTSQFVHDRTTFLTIWHPLTVMWIGEWSLPLVSGAVSHTSSSVGVCAVTSMALYVLGGLKKLTDAPLLSCAPKKALINRTLGERERERVRRKEQNEDGFEGKEERARGRRCRRSSAALRTAQSRLRSSALPCCPVLDRVRRRATVPRPLCCPEVKRGNSAVGSSRTRGQRPRTGCSNQRSHRDARSYAGSGQLERGHASVTFPVRALPPTSSPASRIPVPALPALPAPGPPGPLGAQRSRSVVGQRLEDPRVREVHIG
ncbi:hypothetical protein ISCGN_001500 [Ixodes scapularis]